MKKNLYIGIDLGTSSTKVLLMDTEGNILSTASRDYELEFPFPGWSQQNPEDWRKAVMEGINEVLCGCDRACVKGIAAGGQMHGLVALDEDGNVIRPAILWNDSRCEKQVSYLNNTVGSEKLISLTGNIAFAGFTAPKILWMAENEPDNFARVKAVMLPKDYINYILTGNKATDYSDAAGTLLLDVANKRWSEEMLSICKVHSEWLPELYESSDCIGRLLPEIASELGLSEDVIVAAGAGDNAAAAVGTGTVGNGECNISLGTSGTVFISCESFTKLPTGAIHNFAHADGKFHFLACILSAASCNKWLMDNIYKTDDYAKEQANITDAMLGRNEVYFLPYLMGERSPINDTYSRGTFTGINLGTKREDITLAVLEGVAFAFRDNFEIIRRAGIGVSKSKICGGGSKSRLWAKILANVLNMELEIPKTEQGPGMGAAMLAMVACGEYESVHEVCTKFVSTSGSIKPDPEIATRYEKKYAKFKEIYPTCRELFGKLK